MRWSSLFGYVLEITLLPPPRIPSNAGWKGKEEGRTTITFKCSSSSFPFSFFHKCLSSRVIFRRNERKGKGEMCVWINEREWKTLSSSLERGWKGNAVIVLIIIGERLEIEARRNRNYSLLMIPSKRTIIGRRIDIEFSNEIIRLSWKLSWCWKRESWILGKVFSTLFGTHFFRSSFTKNPVFSQLSLSLFPLFSSFLTFHCFLTPLFLFLYLFLPDFPSIYFFLSLSLHLHKACMSRREREA